MQNDMIHAWTSPATPRSFQTVQFHALPARQPMLSKKVVRPRLPHQPGCPLYHPRNSNARTQPTAEDLHAERHDTCMDVASDAQIVPDRAVPCSTRSPADAVQESCGQGYHTSRAVNYIIHATPTQERGLLLRICRQNESWYAHGCHQLRQDCSRPCSTMQSTLSADFQCQADVECSSRLV